MKTAFIYLLLASSILCAAEAHHPGTLSSINVGARYSSVLQNRGVIFYRDFQIDPIFSVFLFDDKLEFLGDSIGYRDFVYSDQLRLRGKLASISDNPLFPSRKSVREGMPDRPDTYEASARAEWFIGGYGPDYSAEIDFGYAKDVGYHHGDYFDIQIKKKLLVFDLPKLGVVIEPNLYSAIGYGDAAHNKYFYGPSAAKADVNNLNYGLWFAFPNEADRFFPIILLSHFEVMGSANRNGEFAKNHDSGWLFSFIAAGGIL